MHDQFPILQSKLAPSRATQLVERDRLCRKLEEIQVRKLAIVVAGAGYGKTTFVAQTLERLKDKGVKCIWYGLDPADGEFSGFLRYLLEGFRSVASDFCVGLESKAVQLSSTSTNHERILATLLASVAELKHHVVLVLDDLHLLPEDSAVPEAISYLLANIPDNLHLILVSRKEPQLPLSRYRVSRQLLSFDETALSFDEDEIAALYSLLSNTSMGLEESEHLLKQTGGWAAALILGAHMRTAQGTEAAEPCLLFAQNRNTPHHLFEYLRENILQHQPEAVQDFMKKTALLQTLDPEFCDALFQRTDSLALLESFCSNHLLTFPAGCTSTEANLFRYHHILQDFLLRELRSSTPKSEIDAFHRDIAFCHLEQGNKLDAMRHLQKGGHHDELCGIITGLELGSLLHYPINYLVDIIDDIPEHIVEQYVGVFYLSAKLASLRGDIHGAIATFKTALDKFRADGNTVGEIKCLKDLAVHHYLTGDVSRALEEVNSLVGAPSSDPFFPLEITGYRLIFTFLVGEFEQTDAVYESTLRRLSDFRQVPDKMVRTWLSFCYSMRFHFSGNFERANDLNSKALVDLRELGLKPLEPLACFQEALNCYYRKRFQEGVEHARHGLKLASAIGIYDHQYAWLLYVHALNQMGLKPEERLHPDTYEAMDMFTSHGHTWGMSSVHELMACHCHEQGLFEEAEKHVRTGLELIRETRLVIMRGALAVKLAAIMKDKEEPGAALEILEAYDDVITIHSFHSFRRALLESEIFSAGGNLAKSRQAMDKANHLAQRYSYEKWLPGQTRQAAPLHVTCLGAFSVRVGDTLVPAKKWRSSKALTIFKYLVLKKGFTAKETLLELLWPEEEASVTNRRFHVALTTLRKILEPELQRGSPSSYIIRQGDSYHLNIGENGTIDLYDVQSLLDRSSRAAVPDEPMALLTKAVELYKGQLFEESPYEEWFTSEREALHGRILQALQKLMQFHENDLPVAIHCAERALSLDPYAETIYATLMRHYAATGDRANLVRTYQRCVDNISEELGLPLAQETRQLYTRLSSPFSD